MKIYILLLVIGTGRTDGGMATLTERFSSLESCQKAATQIRNQTKDTHSFVYVLSCNKSSN